jgi:hypothetical protein
MQIEKSYILGWEDEPRRLPVFTSQPTVTGFRHCLVAIIGSAGPDVTCTEAREA